MQSIAISIAKTQSIEILCKLLKSLQSISLKVAILNAILQSIAISIAKTQSIAILCKLLESPLQITKGVLIRIGE